MAFSKLLNEDPYSISTNYLEIITTCLWFSFVSKHMIVTIPAGIKNGCKKKNNNYKKTQGYRVIKHHAEAFILINTGPHF